jgi:hypothetical protein
MIVVLYASMVSQANAVVSITTIINRLEGPMRNIHRLSYVWFVHLVSNSDMMLIQTLTTGL